MALTLQPLTRHNLSAAGRCNSAYVTAARLTLQAANGVIITALTPMAPREKHYPIEAVDYAAYVGNTRQAVFLAFWGDAVGGEARVRRGWNGYAYLEELVVDSAYRRRGLGRALLREVAAWARVQDLPGIMLETQDINVAACKLYAASGFKLLGFDAGLYRATLLGTDEIALFWYLDFGPTAN